MDFNGANEKIFEFADFRLIPGESLLLRDGNPLNLNPKAFAVLTLLVEHHGHLVQKSEIIEQVWEDAFVEEGAIAKSIWFIRNALGDTSKERFIQTVPRRGYRFVVPVTVSNDRTASAERELISTGYRLPLPDEASVPSGFVSMVGEPSVAANGDGKSLAPELKPTDHRVNEVDLPPQPRQVLRPRYRSAWMWGGITLFTLLLSGLIVSGYFIEAPTAADANVKKLAILPTKPIDANNRDNHYEVGVADAIISSLSQVQGFEVRSLNAVLDYNSIKQDPVIAGREQKVDYVLAPSYQLAGGRIRITAPLINVAAGKVEDTLRFEMEATSYFAVQDAVAASFSSDLMRRFARTGSGPSAKRGTDNEEAYQLYQQAMYLSDKKRSREAMPKVIEWLEQAVSLDPNYAQAWAGKALAHMWAYDSSSDQQYQNSMEALGKALAVDPNNPDAHSALCQNKFTYEYDFAGAEAACKRAVELSPNSSIAHQIYAHFLAARDRRDEAFAEIKTAIDLQPASHFNKRYYANFLHHGRRHDEAIAQYKQLNELDPTSIGTYNWIIRALEAQGNEPGAFEWFIRSLTLQERDQKTIQRFRDAYRISGWRGVLLERIKTPEVDRGSTSDFRLAGLYARVGNKDKAFEYLEKSYLRRHVLFTTLRNEPQLDSIRDDPRYADLVRRLEGTGVR